MGGCLSLLPLQPCRKTPSQHHYSTRVRRPFRRGRRRIRNCWIKGNSRAVQRSYSALSNRRVPICWHPWIPISQREEHKSSAFQVMLSFRPVRGTKLAAISLALALVPQGCYKLSQFVADLLRATIMAGNYCHAALLGLTQP